MLMVMRTAVPSLLLAALISSPQLAVGNPEPGKPSGPASRPSNKMTDAHLDGVLRRLDPKVEIQKNVRRLVVEGIALVVVTDAAADRMRIMSPIGPTAELKAEDYARLLQANFDAVLDARYAIAQGLVWSAFIHPLSPLTDEQLASAIAQVVVAASTYGTTFTSGALIFGGGDTQRLHRELFERIRKRGQTDI